jgi:hypothetical protein
MDWHFLEIKLLNGFVLKDMTINKFDNMVSLFFIDLELPIDPPYQPPWGILKGMFF